MTDTVQVPLVYTSKSVGDRRSFAFDFSAAQEFQRMAGHAAETIVSYAVLCDNNDGQLVVETPILTGLESNPLVLSAYISGGTVGKTYEIRFHIVTNAGSVIDRTVLLPVAVL